MSKVNNKVLEVLEEVIEKVLKVPELSKLEVISLYIKLILPSLA